jgi:hypothetical protein
MQTESWKVITFAPNYMVSDHGRVMSIFNGKDRILKVRSVGAYLGVQLCFDGAKKNFYVHRLVASHFVANPEMKPEVDHIDRNKYNNLASNLRWSSRSENLCNRKGRGITGYKGVTAAGRIKFRASLFIGNKNLIVGYYDTAEEAAKAYDAKARELYKDFAYLNFPEEITRA